MKLGLSYIILKNYLKLDQRPLRPKTTGYKTLRRKHRVKFSWRGFGNYFLDVTPKVQAKKKKKDKIHNI